eukprot:m.18992 g.18992  ORF g.18992 m.18992 type:complete len:561 (-) comp6462_c0_seq1:154-1836(-)
MKIFAVVFLISAFSKGVEGDVPQCEREYYAVSDPTCEDVEVLERCVNPLLAELTPSELQLTKARVESIRRLLGCATVEVTSPAISTVEGNILIEMKANAGLTVSRGASSTRESFELFQEHEENMKTKNDLGELKTSMDTQTKQFHDSIEELSENYIEIQEQLNDNFTALEKQQMEQKTMLMEEIDDLATGLDELKNWSASKEEVKELKMTLQKLNASHQKLLDCISEDGVLDKDGACQERPPNMPTEKELKTCAQSSLGLIRFNSVKGEHEACGYNKYTKKYVFYDVKQGPVYVGAVESAPANNCQQLKDLGMTSGSYWLKYDDGAYLSRCDFSKSDMNLGNDGTAKTKPGLSCKSIKANYKATANRAYWILENDEIEEMYCDMTLDGGGWTMVWMHAYGTINGWCGRGCTNNYLTTSTTKRACTAVKTNDWCNYPPKKDNVMKATEMMVGAYHNNNAVYMYKAPYNTRLGNHWMGVTVHEQGRHNAVLDKCRNSRGVPPAPGCGGSGPVCGLTFDKHSPSSYTSNCDTDWSAYGYDCRWENCNPVTGNHNQMTMAIFVR